MFTRTREDPKDAYGKEGKKLGDHSKEVGMVEFLDFIKIYRSHLASL